VWRVFWGVCRVEACCKLCVFKTVDRGNVVGGRGTVLECLMVSMRWAGL
jgi:hypothetical protein